MLVALLLLLVFTLRTTVVSIFSSISCPLVVVISMVFINNPGVMSNNTRMVITRLLFFMTMRTIMLLILNMSMVTMARVSCTRHKSNRQEGNEEFHFGFLRTEDFPPCAVR